MIPKFFGSVFSNGEFSIGSIPSKLRHDDIAVSKDRYSKEQEWRSLALREHGLDSCREALGGESPLGLSSLPISHTRAPKGLKGISSNGQRNLRVGGYELQQVRSHHRVGFGTLTVPPLSDEDYVAVHENWPHIVRTFIQWLKRRLASKGVIQYILYVSEIQTKREKKHGKSYLHLHFCYPASRKFDYRWYVPASDMRVAWKRAVSSFAATELDFSASIDCVVVKKSVGRYLGKYLTKGVSDIQAAIGNGLPVAAVGHWWGWSSALRDRVRSGTLRAADLVEWLWRNLDRLRESGCIQWLKFVYIETAMTGQRCVGCCGQLTSQGKKVLYCIYSTLKQGNAKHELTQT